MEWLANQFTKYPEMAVYLVMVIGYLIGGAKVSWSRLGGVTGSLLGGILIGNFFHVPSLTKGESMLFLLFLFEMDTRWACFFSNLKGEGWRWVVLGVFVQSLVS